MIWVLFSLAAAVIVYAGTNLSRYGEVIADRTKLGQNWIGVVLVASVTSLPELVNGSAASGIFGVPDLAVGDVLGSCLFNLLLIALLDALAGRTPVASRARAGHQLSLAFGVLLIAVVGIGFLAEPRLPSFLGLGLTSWLLAGLYLLGVKTIFLQGRRELTEDIGEMAGRMKSAELTLRGAIVRYAANAVLVALAGTALPHLASDLAARTGLGQTFVGNAIVALVTSLPETVVCIAALRLGAVDLAFGNIFGSNMFNMIVLVVGDACYRRGPILEAVDPSHLIVVLGVVLMNAIALVGLAYRSVTKRLLLGWDAIGMVLAFLSTILLTYAATRSA